MTASLRLGLKTFEESETAAHKLALEQHLHFPLFALAQILTSSSPITKFRLSGETRIGYYR